MRGRAHEFNSYYRFFLFLGSTPLLSWSDTEWIQLNRWIEWDFVISARREIIKYFQTTMGCIFSYRRYSIE